MTGPCCNDIVGEFGRVKHRAQSSTDNPSIYEVEIETNADMDRKSPCPHKT